MVYGIKENKSFENVLFTYVVDSNASLTDWANNKSGNDYSCVLIKKGRFESSVPVNLSESNTKIIIGEVDNNLVFKDVDVCFIYDTKPNEAEAFIQNINVTRYYSGDENTVQDRMVIGFKNCVNISNCKLDISSANNNITAFNLCKNLNHCVVNGTANGDDFTGYNSCENLIDCYLIDGAGANVVGFINCFVLNECRTINLLGTTKGFDYCNDLFNCIADTQIGFSNCNRLSNCTANNTSETAYKYGFQFCNVLNNCTAFISGSDTDYGFSGCHKLIFCIAQEGKFDDSYTMFGCEGEMNACYASSSENSTYAVANTPNGGFNIV